MKPNRYAMIGVTALLLVTGISGLMHGRVSNRWGPSSTTKQLGTRLATASLEKVGPWIINKAAIPDGSKTIPLGTKAENMLECTGYQQIQYVNANTGESVTVAVIVGPQGPMSVHLPEICYSSRDYDPVGKRQNVKLRDTDRFWALTLRSKSVDEHRRRVYYAWTTGDDWLAPESARIAFFGKPYLYKIQISGVLAPEINKSDRNDPCLNFLEHFLPALDQVIGRKNLDATSET